MAHQGAFGSGLGRKRIASVAVALALLAGMLAVLPVGTQNASGYMTPGMGMMLTFDDLVLMSGGAVTGAFPIYQVHETLTIMPSDTLIINGGLNILMDPGMNIAIEVLGMLDGNIGFGTLFHSFGPGAWRGIWVHDSGAMTANGFMIWDAQDGIYIDHTMGFGMVQITGCTVDGALNAGITMLGTMGGPMVQGNTVIGSPVGFRLVATTAQCQNNEVMNCGIGFSVQGNPGPGIFGNRIHDNGQSAVHVESANTWLSSNVIRDNQGDAVVLFNSTASFDSNDIFAWNATPGSNLPGMSGVVIDGTSIEWGQNWFTNNNIIGGNGDGSGNGGDAVRVRRFEANLTNGWVENTVLENNRLLMGGNGGQNFNDFSAAGNGGSAVYVERLPDDGDWTADNHAVIIRSNMMIAGGHGGMDNSFMGGMAGNGGHGICVRDDNNAGSLLVTGNSLVIGGNGGGAGSPMGLCGDGGRGMCLEDCDSGVRTDIRNHPDVVGGNGGFGPAGWGRGGASMRFLRCDDFHVSNVSGRSSWTFGEIEGCDGDFDLKDIKISDSNANSGNLVRATGSSSTGNNENWVFDGKNGVGGIIIKDSNGLKVKLVRLKASNATAALIQNSGNISLDRVFINVTDGIAIDLNSTINVTVFDSVLNGSRLSSNPEVPVLFGKGAAATTLQNGRVFVKDKATPTTTKPPAAIVFDPDNGGNRFDNVTIESENRGGVGMRRRAAPPILLPISRIQNCSIRVKNGTGFEAIDCRDFQVVESFFDIYSDNETANFTGMDLSNMTGMLLRNNTVKAKNATAQKIVGFVGVNIWGDEYDVDPGESGDTSPVSSGAVMWENGSNITMENTNILARNGTGISATNVSGLKVIGVGLGNVPHPTYKGHGTRFKAIARGGCSDSDFNWSEAPGWRWTMDVNESHNITLSNNTFRGSGTGGILVNNSRDCVINGNIVQGKEEGIRLQNSQYNAIFHNNFLGNAIQASDDTGLNLWDNGYPSGGNYWSDYIGPDVMQGPLQNIPGADWIGDVPYPAIAGGTGTQDSYPLAKPTIDGRVQHMPFRINSNADFDWEHGVVNWATGDGSEANPWLIENWDVNGTGSIMGGYPACIYIGNTTQHFMLVNCALREARDSGVELRNVTGGLVGKNEVYDVWWGNGMGIFVISSNNGTIEDNLVHGQRNHGIILDTSMEIDIMSNNASANGKSGLFMKNSYFTNVNRNVFSSNADHTVWLSGSNDNVLKYNIVLNATQAGLYLDNSDDNAIDYNAAYNTWCGLLLLSSENNNISGNTFDFNRDYGLVLMSGSNNNAAFGNVLANSCTGIEVLDSHLNAIHHNNIMENLFQANDSTGTNLWHNGYPSGGNYWSDYVGPDLMSGPLQNIPGPDGIGDIPYLNIQGGTGAVDQYPLMTPWTPEPVSFFNISLQIGWNLISIPLELEDTGTADVLASISGKYDSVKAYDTLDFMDPWKSYRQGGTVNDLAAIDNTIGVWVRATEACTLSVSGHIPTSTAIPLYAGWNLVGYPTMIARTAQDALAGTGADIISVFDGASPVYIQDITDLSTVMMMPGQGYWVHVPADTLWTIDW